MSSTNDNNKEIVEDIIYVDDRLKRCDKKHSGARTARYVPEYELYVVDH